MTTTEIIEYEFSVRLEQQEAAYWSEYYRKVRDSANGVVPADISDELGMDFLEIGGAIAGVAANIDILAFNRVIGLGLEQPVAEKDLDEIITFYGKSGVRRFFVQLSPAAKPENLPDILREKGFEYYNNWVKWFREIEPLPVSNSKLRIKEIGAEEANIFAHIITTAFEWQEELKPMLKTVAGRPGWKHYLAYDGEKPVGCAALFMKGEFASLAFAATLPQHRGKGAQSALIVRRFQDAAEAGCRWMVTETAEDTPERPVASFRNMRRHGFQIAYKRANYILNES